MKQADFLRAIARRLGRGEPLRAAPAHPAPGAPDFWRAYRLERAQLASAFAANFERQGGRAIVCGDLPALRAALAEILREMAPATIGVWGGGFLAAHGLEDVLADCGARVVASDPEGASDSVAARAEPPAEFAQVDASVTGCRWAIADTGTIVIAHGAGRERSLSLLPAVHIVIVRTDQIRTRLGEVLAELASRPDAGAAGESGGRIAGLPANVLFMSGPSRSSDIENDLTIGVHGPAAVIALLYGGAASTDGGGDAENGAAGKGARP